MNARFQEEQQPSGNGSQTHQTLLKDEPTSRVPESVWLSLIRGVAEGDTSSFGTLYTWTHEIVFTLMMRISRKREIAEALTVDVFHDVWRTAANYDPVAGSVVGWILNLSRARALERLRSDGVEKFLADRIDPAAREQLHKAFRHLTPTERRAIEAAYFSRLTYLEVGVRYRQPVEIVKVIIRGAIDKVRVFFARGGEQ